MLKRDGDGNGDGNEDGDGDQDRNEDGDGDDDGDGDGDGGGAGVTLPANTKDPTHEMKPARNELYGNEPKRTRYMNCNTPVTNVKRR